MSCIASLTALSVLYIHSLLEYDMYRLIVACVFYSISRQNISLSRHTLCLNVTFIVGNERLT